MKQHGLRGIGLMGLMLFSLVVFFVHGDVSAASVGSAGSEETYIVVYQSSDLVNQALIRSLGHTLVGNLAQAGVLIVKSTNPLALTHVPGVVGVVPDQVHINVPQDEVRQVIKSSMGKGGVECASTTRTCPLQWDLQRVDVSEAWRTTRGSAKVKVAVLDTGLKSGHEEVGANYDRAESKSFVQPNGFCSQDATTYASTEDFQGHGTWTNLHVGGVDGPMMSGIAPATTLINVRVLGACGGGDDSWILQGMMYANLVGASVESMSLGGFICGQGVIAGSYYCGDSTKVGQDQVLYRAYSNVVRYLLAHGTAVVAASGNEHVQLNARGLVVNHASLAGSQTKPNLTAFDPSNDLYGLAEVPGGIPGVISVAATNRLTQPGQLGETRRGQFGAGREDQLAYYSNYGTRIDVSAPGGARDYNIPEFNCLTSNCGRLNPTSSIKDNNPGDFGAWAFDAAGGPCDTCYVNIQGTSMATPQVAGVAALYLAAHPGADVRRLAYALRRAVDPFERVNATPAATTDPAKPTYNYDLDYKGAGIPNSQMGTGLISALKAVTE